MIMGKLSDLQKQFCFPYFSKVIYYLRSLDKQKIVSQLEGNNSFVEEIQGRDTYAVFIAHHTKERSKKQYEAHRKYIDVQCILEGTEMIEFRHIE